MKTNTVYLLLGSNLGDSANHLRGALRCVEEDIGEVVQASRVYKSKAWGKTDQPDFLNQVVMVDTKLSPYDVLARCLKIENDLGRVRFERWGARAIDIDILYFNQDVVHTKLLKIPHPELHNRRFTLVPLNEIAGDFIHPVLNKSQAELLQSCPDDGEVVPLKEN